MKFFFYIFFCFFAYIANANENQIKAVVNDEVITAFDINIRYESFLAENNITFIATLSEKDDIKSHLLSQLIDDVIKKQLADKENIPDQFSLVQQQIETLKKQQNFTDKQFKASLRKNKINYDDYKKFLNQQFRWLALVDKEFRANNPINDSDVTNQISYIKAHQGENEYLLSEIKIPFNSFTKASSFNVIKNIISNINRGVRFDRIVNDLEKNQQILEGNHLGWVIASQYEEFDIEKELLKKTHANIIGPVETSNHFILLQVLQKRKITYDEDRLDRSVIKQQLELNAKQFFAKQLLNIAKQDSFIEIR